LNSITLNKHILKLAEEISDQAGREYSIEKKVEILEENWKTVEFMTIPFKTPGTFTIGGWGDIYTRLDEDVIEVQQMEISPFKGVFESVILEWSTLLLDVTYILENLKKFQVKWMQLQPIFESPDIPKSIPHEYRKFNLCDKFWRSLVLTIKDLKHIVKTVCSEPGLLQTLEEKYVLIEEVERGLNDYVDKKKSIFPRFFFISQEDLIEIISSSKDLNKIKDSLKKIFDNIHYIHLRDEKVITTMLSNLREEVSLKEQILIIGKNVEVWMKELESSMFLTVNNCFEQAIKTYKDMDRHTWLYSNPGQSCMHSQQVFWTQEVEEAILENKIETNVNEIQERINLLVSLIRGQLDRIHSITISNLITLEVHNKEVTNDLIQYRVDDLSAFEWIKQLRYYWEKTDCQVKSIQTSFPYGNEYLGNTEILVITPLTDKCYLTLMGALKLNMGGAPAGPAGTGKTESTKDLAKAIAKQCIVYNCSEETDFSIVAKFFKGLACCGSWICFDEFNRINIEVLSVIAQMLILLFKSKEMGDVDIVFEKTNITIKDTFCVFITMNPGYEGRTDLPDNLKALFRPMAMMVPNYRLISEVYLYSSGYLLAKDLAKKIYNTFQLSSQQLSGQFHYDFGMRAVKSVLYASRKFKRQFPEEKEDKLLLRALEDVNVPKFLKEDIPLFKYIIKDLFPTTEKPESDLTKLINKVKDNTKYFNLQPTEQFIGKVMQLYDTIQVRHGLMLVGPTGGGKSSNYKLLRKSLSDLSYVEPTAEELLDPNRTCYYKTEVHVLNPKSVKKDQLYCEKDPNTMEWVNGILPNIVHEINADPMGMKHWILFDGPVDTLWIEDLNSVLDDSRKLCLASSAIIVLNECITMMFEVEDLLSASPATVSRCGMVYMEPKALGLLPILNSYIDGLPKSFSNTDFNIAAMLKDLLSTVGLNSINFIRKQIKEPCPTTDPNLFSSLLKLLDCFFDKYREQKNIEKNELEIIFTSTISIFYYCLIWSIGITGNEPGRLAFSNFVLTTLFEKTSEYYSKIFVGDRADEMNNLIIPIGKYNKTGEEFFKENPDQEANSNFTVYDFCFDVKEGKWKNFIDYLIYPSIDSRAAYTDIIIPTVDSVRYTQIVKLLLLNNKHLITTGPTGTGKTVNLMDSITRGLSERYVSLVINFSAQTSAGQTQASIDDKLKQITRKDFAPPNNKIMIVFLDDLNMPKKERFGAQPPIEIIRQWMDYKGWFNLKKSEKPFVNIKNLVFAGGMGPPGGGKAFLSNRFMRHFNLINYTELADQSIVNIFERKVKHFLSKFNDQVKAMIPLIVKSTLDVYKEIKETLLPIPKTPHYQFNLRDMSKVLQGVCFASFRYTVDTLDGSRLWVHEMTRAFGDRLINDEDRNWIQEKIEKRLQTEFNMNLEELFNTGKKIIFCDFMGGGNEKPYRQVEDIKLFIKKVESKLSDFNDNTKSKPMRLVMFLDACDHVARICRIIRQTQGHALLLGVGGSGRQSLARLSSFINDYDCAQIEVTKGYTMVDFRKNLKDILKKAGIAQIPVSFLIVDTQIFNELLLEDVNNCLNTGDVPDLYKAEDWDEIRTKFRSEVATRNLPETDTNMFNAFLSSVRSRIHLIIAMSPIGETFSNRLRNLPSLVNCCTIDWFSEWPEEALKGVASDKLEEYELDLGKTFNETVECIKYIHKSVEAESATYLQELRRFNYLTPTSFLEFLLLYKGIFTEKNEEIENNINRYEMGLKVLEFAGEKIKVIEEDIRVKTPELIKTTEEVNEYLKILEVKKAEAEEIQKEANEEKSTAEILNREITEIDQKCRAALDITEKEVNQSLEKINNITDDNLREVGNMKEVKGKFANLIEMLLIFKTGNDYKRKENCNNLGLNQWELDLKKAMFKDLNVGDVKEFKSFFTQFQKEEVRENLKNNNKDKVDAAYEFIVKNQMDGNYAQTASKAIYPAFDFVIAMKDFVDKSLTIVDPMKAEAAEMKAKKEEADLRLAKAQNTLDEATAKVNHLEREYDEKLTRKNDLQNEIAECQLKVQRAKMLVELLSSEKIRWREAVQALLLKKTSLLGDCLIAAGLIAYSGTFVSKYRDNLQSLWKKKLTEENIEISQDVSLLSVMENKLLTREWNMCKLPNDKLSVENGIIMFKTRRWPLMIDPQSQATDFLKTYGPKKKENFQIIKATDLKMIDQIITGVKLGFWIMLENVGVTLETSLEPILQQQKIVSRSGAVEIKIGEKMIPYNENFKLFMLTNMNNPHYSPETFAKITIINFAITQEGLADQMLSEIIKIEMPEIEENKIRILEENFKNQATLKDIEDRILDNLSSKKDNIEETLKSSELIDILTEAKETAKVISIRMEESKKMSEEIDKKRKTYIPSAFRASVLFFALLELSTIDPMYQFSLFHFKSLFKQTVNKIPPVDSLDQRILDINSKFSKEFFDYTCRSLYEKDKILFAFVMCVKILQNEQPEKIKSKELRLFLAGPSSELNYQLPDNPTKWISATDWNSFYSQLYALSKISPNINDLAEHFLKNHQGYFPYFECPKSEFKPLPFDWEKKCTNFQKLLIVKTLRLDKLGDMIENFIQASIGKEFTEIAGFDLPKSYSYSNNSVPLLFVLSTGSDPTNDLKMFADQQMRKLEFISLGKGVEKSATQKIIDMKIKGGWMALQNCHLGISFMPTLEKIIEDLAVDSDVNFRLWLTSMSEKDFSINALKSSIKITMEPPKGLRNNLQRQYNAIKEEELESCTKPEAFKSFFFSLCFFHAIVQDRRKFGPIGWNESYDFTNEDLMVSKKQLKNFLEEYDTIPYKVLHYLIAEINYGGRITDYNDQTLNNTILNTYLRPEILTFEEYKFSSSGKYYSPQPGSKNDYMNFIKSLDGVTSPEVFGLHENAEITTAQNEASKLLDTVLSIQPRASSSGGKKPEDTIIEICNLIQSTLPENYNYEETFKKYPTDYKESMNTVLIQEILRYNSLLDLIKEHIKQLKLALAGRIVMSDEMDKISNSLYNNQVPSIWVTRGFLTLKPLLSWMNDFKERIKFFATWVDNGTPKVFDLPKFSVPQAFLTGTLQNYARKHEKEIDLLNFEFFVHDQLRPERVAEKPEDGCYVSGLFIEGAKWNFSTHVLGDPKNRELYSEMPMILLKPTANKEEIKGIYSCPLYKVLSRRGTLSTTGHSTNFVLKLELPSSDDESKWIKAGVAMFLALKQ